MQGCIDMKAQLQFKGALCRLGYGELTGGVVVGVVWVVVGCGSRASECPSRFSFE